jgi:hypothetical protein
MNAPNTDPTPGNLDGAADMRTHSFTDESRFSGKSSGRIGRSVKAESVLDKLKRNGSGMSPLLIDRIQTQELLGGEP